MKRPEALDEGVVERWLDVHPWWRRENGHLVREVTTRDYPSSAAIVIAQVELSERLDHHPILTLGYCELRVELWTHDRAALTQLDLDWAEGFDQLVRDGFADATGI